MKDVVSVISALVFSGVLFGSLGMGIKEIHDTVKKETLKKVSKGLSSSEELANALTGETLGF